MMINRQISYILSIVFFLLIQIPSQAGGGWTHKKGVGFFKFSQSVIFGNAFYTSTGDVLDLDQPVNLYTTSLYGEYGITDRFNVMVYAPVFVRSTISKAKFKRSGEVLEGDEMNAIGDFDIGFKYGFIQNKKIVLSGSLTLGLPFGETSGGEGMVLQSGDGEFNQLIKVEASTSFYPSPVYASVSVGFNNRTKNFSDEFHFGGEVGVTLKQFVGILKFYNVSSFYNGDADGSQGNGIFSNNTEYFSFGPELLYKFTDRVGVSASGGFALSGRQILAAPNWSLGVFFSL